MSGLARELSTAFSTLAARTDTDEVKGSSRLH
jgi:hypothetical protein